MGTWYIDHCWQLSAYYFLVQILLCHCLNILGVHLYIHRSQHLGSVILSVLPQVSIHFWMMYFCIPPTSINFEHCWAFMHKSFGHVVLMTTIYHIIAFFIVPFKENWISDWLINYYTYPWSQTDLLTNTPTHKNMMMLPTFGVLIIFVDCD